MIVTFDPTDHDRGDKHVWEWDPDRVFADEAEVIEAEWDGKPWDHFVMMAKAGATKARRLLLWHLLRTEHPGQYQNVKDVPRFRTGEITIDQSSKEMLVQRGLLEESPALTDAERKQALTAWDTEYARAVEREGKTAEHTDAGQIVVPELPEVPKGDPVPEIPLPSEPSPTFGGTTG